jgi:hypothetical protein
MDERSCRNLLVERILRIHPESTPDMCDFLIEWQNRVRVGGGDLPEPTFQAFRLCGIPAMPETLHA